MYGVSRLRCQTEDMSDHKSMTKHIRGRLAAAGIKARCSKYESCGTLYIRVLPPTADARFTDEQSTQIKRIAKVNALTGAHGSEIDESVINSAGCHFEYNGPRAEQQAAREETNRAFVNLVCHLTRQ